MTPKEYVESGKHLPRFLRDFHDQKDFFKMVDLLYRTSEESLDMPNWRESHCYVIDWFLWYLGQRGWTLQRSRANVEFKSMEDDFANYKKTIVESLANMMGMEPNGS